MTKCRSKKDTVKRVTVQEFIVSTMGLQMIRAEVAMASKAITSMPAKIGKSVPQRRRVS